jgi:hypothetical protein
MDISMNANVRCSDGQCGRSINVMLKPASEEITHLVIESNRTFPTTEYLVPINLVVESSPGQIRIDCSTEDLSKMPIFYRSEFIPYEIAGYAGMPYLMWGFHLQAGKPISMAINHIPTDELVIRHGAKVEATDGPIGQVDEFVLNPVDDHITQLVMREGHLWRQKSVAIPASEIDHYENSNVFLKLDKKAIENLPRTPFRHNRS